MAVKVNYKNMNTRQKGMILSKYVADQIVAKGIDTKACADGGSGAGNREKADVHTSMLVIGQQAGIECKNQKNINHKESWRQTKKLEKLGCEPILAFKDFGEPLEECKIIIYLDTFLELVRLSNISPEPQKSLIGHSKIENDRELAYALNTLKIAVNKVNKLLKVN